MSLRRSAINGLRAHSRRVRRTDHRLSPITTGSTTGVTSLARRSAATLLLTLTLLPTLAQAQSVEWVRSAGGTSNDKGAGIAVDAAGNSYVTGQYADTATFGPFTLTSAGSLDIFVVKYDDAGNVLWARSAGGALPDDALAISVDAVGNSYVTGWFRGTATFGPFTLTSAGHSDYQEIFVAKFDSGGNVLWAQSAGGTSANDEGWGIAVDVAGNSYVTGFYLGTATFGPFTLVSAGGGETFVAKYDDSGEVLWVRSGGGGGSSGLGSAIAVDTAGNSYVAGQYVYKVTFEPFTLNGAGSADIFVVKYDDSGEVLWARSAGGASWDSAWGIAVDTAGNSYVTGGFGGAPGLAATFWPFTLFSAGGFDIFVAKYDDSGNVLWARRAGGGSSGEEGWSIAVDVVGNCYVTGFYLGTATFGPFTLIGAGGDDIFVARYDPGGSVLWAQSAGGGASNDFGLGIAVDAAGNSYVTGHYARTVTFGPFSLTSAGLTDIFVSKYGGPPADPPSSPDLTLTQAADSNRYLTFVPTNPGLDTALQVKLIESEEFPEAVGATWWVGPPDVYCENGAEVNAPCTPAEGIPSSTFLSSSLQCAQHCMDWGSPGETLHVGDINVVPGAVYRVRAINCGSDPDEATNYSLPLPVATSQWGDTILTCEGCPCGPPEGIVNIIDCKGVVDRFVSAPCAPLKSRVDLEPAIPDRQINITDALQCVRAFQGVPYDLSVPVGCE